MKNSIVRKILCFITTLITILALCSSVFAENPEQRLEIVIRDENEIAEFIRSGNHSSDFNYAFIIPSDIQARMRCPSCGGSSYRGYTEHREMDIHPRLCPYADFSDDLCYEYDVYAYSMCDNCGYSTSKVFSNRYWLVVCHVEMPDGWGTYIARPGQSYRDGYDFHEDPEYMKLI